MKPHRRRDRGESVTHRRVIEVFHLQSFLFKLIDVSFVFHALEMKSSPIWEASIEPCDRKNKKKIIHLKRSIYSWAPEGVLVYLTCTIILWVMKGHLERNT